MVKEKKLWKKGLSVLLIFQIVVALSLAILALYDFPMLAAQFGFDYQPEMGLLRLIMVYNLCLSAGICTLSVRWIRQDNIAGIEAGTMIGFLMFIVSFAAFIQFDRLDMLLFDSIRALLMVIFGVLAYNTEKRLSKTV